MPGGRDCSFGASTGEVSPEVRQTAVLLPERVTSSATPSPGALSCCRHPSFKDGEGLYSRMHQLASLFAYWNKND